MPKKVGKYEIGRTLGEGTFGKVKKAVNTETGEVVAIKVLDKEKIQKQNMGSQVKKEISIMKLVRHHHVVQLTEVLASRTKIFIVLEIVTGGELFDKIVADQRFDEETARFYFQQLVVGCDYCHGQGVCHRDLKPENLLLDGNGDLKISDFGLSALYEGGADGPGREELLHTTCGTPNYVAPEVLADKGYDGKCADTWSMGVILYVFLAGFLPFDEPTMSALFRKIQAAEFTYPSWFTDEIKELLDNILVPNPSERWTIPQIMEHSWWKKGGPYAEGSVNTTTSEGAAAASEGSMSTAPSEADLNAAVQDAPAEEGQDSSEQVPKRINAFDLINTCGGNALSRMFQSSDEKKLKKVHLFATQKSNTDITDAVAKKFQSMNDSCKVDVYAQGYKMRGAFSTARGQLDLKVEIKIICETPLLHLVEVSRGRGDLMTFTQYSEQIQEETNGFPPLAVALRA